MINLFFFHFILVFGGSKRVISNIQVAAGDPLITLSPSDSDTTSVSCDAHDISDPIVRAISVHFLHKMIPRFVNVLANQGNSRNLSRGTALHMYGKALSIET